MKYLNLFIILAELLVISCTQSPKKQDSITVVDFNRDQNAVTDIFETNFVKLETNENCLITNIRQIESLDNRIFILSGRESCSLFVFDRSGKFITSAGRMGSGPGEYIFLTSFSIDRHRNIISVADAAQQKIINYSTENYKFVSEDKTSDNTFLCFEYLDADKIVWT
ncbi:MAG: 6-bladed beta-propeller, partial [Prevotellaceae bacterium]|nr:6-bladed beta-propeller [Prevotellaceae bacterium]